MFLHQHKDFKDLIELTARKEKIDDPALVEKDYWIMHCLFSISQLDLGIELKGGTSLSKGYGIIHRFSEDIDLKIIPSKKVIDFEVSVGKNQDKPAHRESRKKFFEWLHKYLNKRIDGIAEVARDQAFDDIPKYRNGGIRLIYNPVFSPPLGLKEGILLEVGFDKTTPSKKKDISSWAFDFGHQSLGDRVTDNRAHGIACYEPQYTFVEKLHAIVRKYRQYSEQKDNRNLPDNFLRHYYDLFCLLKLPEVQSFIGTTEYVAHKKTRFGNDDIIVTNCAGFHLRDKIERELFQRTYEKSASLYYRGQVPFDELLKEIQSFLDKM